MIEGRDRIVVGTTAAEGNGLDTSVGYAVFGAVPNGTYPGKYIPGGTTYVVGAKGDLGAGTLTMKVQVNGTDVTGLTGLSVTTSETPWTCTPYRVPNLKESSRCCECSEQCDRLVIHDLDCDAVVTQDLYSAGSGADVQIVSPISLSQVSTLTGGTHGAYAIAINSAGTAAYILDGDNQILVVDIASNSITHTIVLGAFATTSGNLLLNHAGTTLYVNNSTSGNNYAVDTSCSCCYRHQLSLYHRDPVTRSAME